MSAAFTILKRNDSSWNNLNKGCKAIIPLNTDIQKSLL